MPTEQFCTTKHPNFAFIQFYQRCDVVHVSNYIVCSQVAICFLTKLTCVWLRFYLMQKGPLLWMPISCSILNQIGQFQEPWLCPQIVGNFSLGWGHSQNKGPRMSRYSSQQSSPQLNSLFGECPWPMCFTHCKGLCKRFHETNKTYVDYKGQDGECSYTYKKACCPFHS